MGSITTSHNLSELLEVIATGFPEKGLTIYPPKQINGASTFTSYPELLKNAKRNANLLNGIPGIQPNSVVLLHFDNHINNLTWYWATIIAGFIPAISTPLSNDLPQRKKHLTHLIDVLNDPICLTSENLLHDFSVTKTLKISTVESLHPVENGPSVCRGFSRESSDIATLMLTSGSTGNAKAVTLCHGQILTALSGKSQYHGTTKDDIFFNWINLDHVADLTEIHLHAMFLGANQIHVQAADLLQDPFVALEKFTQHKVSYTMSPNFFLASLLRAFETTEKSRIQKLDLSSLRSYISGGEATVVSTVAALSKKLESFGAPPNVISPGFGMTETCAGSIYGKDCPRYDIAQNLEFASLGSGIPGIQMRVTLENGEVAPVNEIGNLEVSGPVVFSHYFNNPKATAEAKTADGWFSTGDRAFIDQSGQLNLAGRSKEIVIINGVHHFPNELDAAIEEQGISGAAPGYTLVFGHRRSGSPTEEICVVYLPTYESDDILSRVQTRDSIVQSIVLATGARPYCVLPLDTKVLQKSTLGKLSRAKISAAFGRGDYKTYQTINDQALEKYRASTYQAPTTPLQTSIFETILSLFEIPADDLSINTSIMDLGITSVDLIKLKQKLQVLLKVEDISITTLIMNPTIEDLASALENVQTSGESHEYDPVVVLQRKGAKKPLWLVHPGVGEVLVFLPLAKYIVDRPLYALRAKGFTQGEALFTDIEEAVTSYYTAMKQRQPEGPYAIAGYSYGAMLAFEVAKKLEKNGDKVSFVGSFNLPPHIKFRMRQLDWIEVILNLSYFLSLMTEEYAHEISPELHKLSREEVTARIVELADPGRLQELDLNGESLANWANIAHHLQAMARDYDPSGKVANIDVFCAIPLSAVAKSREEWVANHLIRWNEHSETPMQLHHVQGSHYTMLGPEHIVSFQKQLRRILVERGL